MKATGIVRRIDDLGRIVVPKEIRRTLRIREGDPLEIFTDREGEIILKKYSPIGELSQFAGEYAESLAQTTGHLVLITDCDICAPCGICRQVMMEFCDPGTFEILLGTPEKYEIYTLKEILPLGFGSANLKKK